MRGAVHLPRFLCLFVPALHFLIWLELAQSLTIPPQIHFCISQRHTRAYHSQDTYVVPYSVKLYFVSLFSQFLPAQPPRGVRCARIPSTLKPPLLAARSPHAAITSYTFQ